MNHSTFVSFIEAYYEYLESGSFKTVTTFEDIKDVDKSLDIFDNFEMNFLKTLQRVWWLILKQTKNVEKENL